MESCIDDRGNVSFGAVTERIQEKAQLRNEFPIEENLPDKNVSERRDRYTYPYSLSAQQGNSSPNLPKLFLHSKEYNDS